MVLSSLITAVLLWGVLLPFDSEYPFLPCWLAGVIASATDPVAVVALLKDLGADKALGSLIEGESLLNDGSAVVLFVLVKNAIGYSSGVMPPSWMDPNPGGQYLLVVEALRILAQMLVLGILFGLVIGKITKTLLRYVYNDRLIEGSLLIAVSYVTFWLAELAMGTSAVLAVVVFGLYMNKHRSVISPECLHFLHQAFELICHLLNTMIFVTAGLQLGEQCLQLIYATTSMTNTESTLQIVAAVLLIYPIVLIARGAALALFYPLLKRWGTRCTWKHVCVMWWGGLRGAVGLALAVSVYHTKYDETMWTGRSTGDILLCRDIPTMILMVSCMVVFSTVVVNGITMAPMMRKLKLTEHDELRVFMLRQAWTMIETETKELIDNIQENNIKHFRKVNWGLITANRLREPTWLKAKDVARDYRAAWLQVINMELQSYIGQFEGGHLGSEAFFILDNFMSLLRAQAARDSLGGEELSDLYDKQHEALLKRMRISRQEEQTASDRKSKTAKDRKSKALAISRPDANMPRAKATTAFGCLTSFLTGARAKRAVVNYEVCLAYLWGQRRVQRLTKSMGELFHEIALQHEDNKENSVTVMHQIESCYPHQINQFKSRHVLSRVLRGQRAMIEHLLHDGALSELDASQLEQEVNERLKHMYRDKLPVEFLIDSTKELLSRAGDPFMKRSSVHPEHHHLHEVGIGTVSAVRMQHAGEEHRDRHKRLSDRKDVCFRDPSSDNLGEGIAATTSPQEEDRAIAASIGAQQETDVLHLQD